MKIVFGTLQFIVKKLIVLKVNFNSIYYAIMPRREGYSPRKNLYFVSARRKLIHTHCGTILI